MMTRSDTIIPPTTAAAIAPCMVLGSHLRLRDPCAPPCVFLMTNRQTQAARLRVIGKLLAVVST